MLPIRVAQRKREGVLKKNLIISAVRNPLFLLNSAVSRFALKKAISAPEKNAENVNESSSPCKLVKIQDSGLES